MSVEGEVATLDLGSIPSTSTKLTYGGEKVSTEFVR